MNQKERAQTKLSLFDSSRLALSRSPNALRPDFGRQKLCYFHFDALINHRLTRFKIETS